MQEDNTLEVVEAGPGIPGHRVVDFWIAIEHLECLSGAVRVNGATIDLRDPELTIQKWKAIGIGFHIIQDSKVSFTYSHPKGLGVLAGVRSSSFRPVGVILESGDKLSLRKVKIAPVSDPTLMDIDRQRATAEVVITRTDGTIEIAPDIITLGHPYLMNPTVNGDLIGLSADEMQRRLEALSSITAQLGELEGSALRLRVGDAAHHLSRFRRSHEALKSSPDLPLGDHWISRVLYTNQNAAIAFGFALALAEGEAGSRRIALSVINTRSRGGVTRGGQLKAEADSWKAEALPVAIRFDAEHAKWSRSKMATEILHYFDWDRPSHKAIEDWLRLEAEEPTGPLRSRARRSPTAT